MPRFRTGVNKIWNKKRRKSCSKICLKNFQFMKYKREMFTLSLLDIYFVFWDKCVLNLSGRGATSTFQTLFNHRWPHYWHPLHQIKNLFSLICYLVRAFYRLKAFLWTWKLSNFAHLQYNLHKKPPQRKYMYQDSSYIDKDI